VLEAEPVDRLVVPAASPSSSGFSSEDIAWLLEHSPGEIVILRANGDPQPVAATA
jgi:hypothetical protein